MNCSSFHYNISLFGNVILHETYSIWDFYSHFSRLLCSLITWYIFSIHLIFNLSIYLKYINSRQTFFSILTISALPELVFHDWHILKIIFYSLIKVHSENIKKSLHYLSALSFLISSVVTPYPFLKFLNIFINFYFNSF